MQSNNTIDKEEINKLVKLVGQGDINAFELLYSKMYKVINYFLLRYSLNSNDIEDIISSTFLVVIEKSKSKIIYKNCFSWILSIAKYQLFNLNRKYSKITFDNDIIDQCTTEQDNNSFSLKFEIEKLSKSSQQILYFIYYLGLPYKDVAKILNISLSTLKRRKNEIIRYLQERYER